MGLTTYRVRSSLSAMSREVQKGGKRSTSSSAAGHWSAGVEGVRAPRAAALVGMMAAVLAVLSWVSLPLPFTPVPLTLQTLGVLLAGALLGPRYGVLATGIYLLLGFVGVPVFHGGTGGPGILFGPTGGFLWGFLPAAFVVGWFARGVGQGGRGSAGLSRACDSFKLVSGLALGSAVIYLVGLPWLSAVTGLGLWETLVAGLLPYLPGDLLKAAAAFALVRGLQPVITPAALRPPAGA